MTQHLPRNGARRMANLHHTGWIDRAPRSRFRIIACCLALALAAVTAGCFEWTEDSQGNLKSVGLPGLPVWKADSGKSASGQAGGSQISDPVAAQLDADNTGAPPPWLNELNRLRAAAGLAPVGQNLTLNEECGQHARYLVEQGPADGSAFDQYKASLGSTMHHEDPSSPNYTAGGAECAQGGKSMPGVVQAGDVSFDTDPVADIDGLFYAPFHRISLMMPSAAVAGYGSFGEWPRRAAALALRGPYDASLEVIRFPADGSVITQGSYAIPEFPDPLASCSGFRFPVGMPITLQIGRGHTIELVSSSLRGPNGPVETCIFDAASYTNPKLSVQKYGRGVLAGAGALIMIPRAPLTDGTYTVTIATERHTLTWSFAVRNVARGADVSASANQ